MLKNKILLSVFIFVLALVMFTMPTSKVSAAGAVVTIGHVLQLGETTTTTASTTEAGATGWTSSNTAVATIDSSTGAISALTAGTTTIAYTDSTSHEVNSISVTVYAVATTDNPAIGEVLVGGSTVTPTSFTAAGAGEMIAWTSSDTGKATINSSSGVITAVARGATTISYAVTNDSDNHIVVKGSLAITVVTTISATAISGVTAPATLGTPVTSVTAGTGYTGTVSWSPNHSQFSAGINYTATVTLTPTTGYTLTGVTANQFTIAGSTATNSINSGVITAVFPIVVGGGTGGITTGSTASITTTTITDTSNTTSIVDNSPKLIVTPVSNNADVVIDFSKPISVTENTKSEVKVNKLEKAVTTKSLKADVKNLQTALNKALGSALSKPLVVDGKWGKSTVAAIKLFQKENNLKQDGVMGPKTRAALNKLLGL